MENSLRFITADEIIADAQTIIDSQDSRDDVVLREWIWDAERNIGPATYQIKTECVDVYDYCIKKPCDMLMLIDMDLLTNGGHVAYYQMHQGGLRNADYKDSRNSGLGWHHGSHVHVAEQQYFFVLSSNADGIDQASLHYYSYPVDDDGNMMIHEDHKDAIMQYVTYMYLKRRRLKGGKAAPPYGEIQGERQEWKHLLAQAKGRNKMPTPAHADTIIRKWLTLIPNYKSEAKHRNHYGSGRIQNY